MISRKSLSQLIFFIMGIHSFISAFVFSDEWRTWTFLAFSDIYFIVFMVINSNPRPEGIHEVCGLSGKTISLIFVSLLILAAIALTRFGPLYPAVEFRPYVESILIFSGINLLGRNVSLSWIPHIFWPFIICESAFLIANYALSTHKVGLFGEMNYDVQLLVVILSLGARYISLFHIIYAIAAKTKTFAVYTVVSWFMQRRITIALLVLILAIAAPWLVDFICGVADDLDRLVILGALLSVVTERFRDILLCGQLFCGNLFYEPTLSWYISTQTLASSLDSVVPAVFHGHFLRNLFLFGLPISVLGYGLLCIRLLRHRSAWLLVGWIVITGISQSIFHHPFVGLALIFTIALYCQRRRGEATN